MENSYIKEMCELALKAFDELPADARLTQFSELTIGTLILKQVINSVKTITEEEFNKICENDFVADVFKRISLFNELGVDLGYAKRVDKDGK